MPIDDNTRNKLLTIYTDVSSEAGLAGPRALYDYLKKHTDMGLTMHQVKEFLAGQTSYVQHVVPRRRYPRRQTVSYGPLYAWQMDFAVLSKSLARQNDNVQGLLFCIDSFSRYLYLLEPVRTFSGPTTAKILDELLSKQRPVHLTSDMGTTFLSRAVQDTLSKHGVNFYASKQDVKAAMVERVILTCKRKIYKLITMTGRKRFLEQLPDIVNSYNHTKHGTLKMAPADVTPDNAPEIFKRIYKRHRTTTKPAKDFRFKVGDRVVVSLGPTKFQGAGYKPRWSEEVFEVAETRFDSVELYRLRDGEGNVEPRFYYAFELQNVSKE